MASGSTAMLGRAAQTTHFSTLRVHVRPARSILSNALNFCRSAIAASEMRAGNARACAWLFFLTIRHFPDDCGLEPQSSRSGLAFPWLKTAAPYILLIGSRKDAGAQHRFKAPLNRI